MTNDSPGPSQEMAPEKKARRAARSQSSPADSEMPRLTPATDADLPAIAALMNLAYRGGDAEAGWTSEADCLAGNRTNEAMLREEIAANPDATLMIWRRSPYGALLGCVWLEPADGDAWYLGSLSIDPREQNQGLGRKLLAAAEWWAFEQGGREIKMTVINVRENLLAWYARRGYTPTSEIKPFPYDDNRFGVPKRDDLNFVVLHKRLRRGAASQCSEPTG